MNQLAVAAPSAIAANPFSFDSYTITRKWLTFLGRDFNVLDPAGNPCMYVMHKLLTFRDEWNVFTDRTMRTPLVRVKARQAIGVDITTDVFDAATGQVVGTVRSKGFKSILRDTWEVLDQGGNVVGQLAEDSNGLLRRMLPTMFGMPLIPGRWSLKIHGQTAMELTEQRVFFGKAFSVSVAPGVVDRRFAVGCALLALMREITRESR